MERDGKQEGTSLEARRAEAQAEIRKKTAEYAKRVEAARASIERLRKQAEERVRSRQAKLAQAAPRPPAATTTEPQREEPATEPAKEHRAATEPVGSEAERQPEAVAEAMKERSPKAEHSKALGAARAKVSQAGRAALGFGKKVSAKAGGLLKKHRPQ